MFTKVRSRLSGWLALGITTTVVAQNTILLDQSNFVYLLNNSNPDLNSNFRVIEDITLPPSWTPVGTPDSPASLRLNGSYHTLFGLNAITHGNNMPTGLFGYLVDSWVHGVILHQPVVLSHGNASEAGSIAGRALRTNITDNLVTGGAVETRGGIGSFSGQYRYSHAGGVTGSASSSRIENNLNNATVHTTGDYCHAGGTTGYQYFSSTTSGNLNTGAVGTVGRGAYAGGMTGDQSSSTTSGNLNTGAVRTVREHAYAGGTTGRQFSSTTSGNLNTGAVHTMGSSGYAGGTTGYQWDSTTSGNLNTGAVHTVGELAYAGGTTGHQWDSTTSGNLNTGTVSTNGTHVDAGGTTGHQWASTTSGNLNTGAVRTVGEHAYAGGTVGNQWRSTSSGNLNTGAVHAVGSSGYAGGTTGFQSYSTNSGNLYSGPVTSASGSVVDLVGSMQVSGQKLRMGLNGLNGTLWTPGDDSQFPMLMGINATYRDLQRINNIFPVELNEFADPGGSVNASLFDSTVWNICCGYLPFLKAIGRDRAEAVGIDCDEGGFACDCDLFTPQPSGTIDHLLYDGQHYHGIIRASSGLAYWTTYEGGNQVALEPCGVYDFADLSALGVLVDAAASDGDSAYLAYHIPELPGQMLAVFTLNGQQYVSSSTLGLDRVASLSVDIDHSRVLVNTGQDICRLPMENTGQEPECDGSLLNPGEAIQAVVGDSGDLYLLVHQEGTGYQIRTVPEIGLRANFIVSIPSKTSLSAITPVLKVIGRHLHLLLVNQDLIIWRQYPLDALPVMFSELWESEGTAPLPQGITPTALSLIAEVGQGQVFVLGHENEQPKYVRLMAADFAPTLDASTDTGAGGLSNINDWPWWGKVTLGVGSTLAASVVTGALLVMGKHAYNHCMHPDKEDTIDKLAKKLRKRKQGGQGERTASPQLPMGARNGFAFGPDGGSVINADPVLTQGIARPYEQRIPQYETVGPRPYEQAVIRTRTTPRTHAVTDAETTINPGHRYEIVGPATGAQVQAYEIVSLPLPNELPAHGLLHQQQSHPQTGPQQNYAQIDPEYIRRKKARRRQKQHTGDEATGAGQAPASITTIPLAGEPNYYLLSPVVTDAPPAEETYSSPRSPVVYHQQPEREPDTLHGVSLAPEPVYVNTNRQ